MNNNTWGNDSGIHDTDWNPGESTEDDSEGFKNSK
jgi:hypothetical protein